VYATWCGPCKYLAKNVFPKDSAGDFFNQHFISVKLDAEKDWGIAFAKTYGVKAYPTLLFFDAKGQLMHRKVGAPMYAANLVEIGQQALDPNQRYFDLHQRFQAGEREKQFLAAYVKATQGLADQSQQAIDAYHSVTTTAEERLTADYWHHLRAAVSQINSPTFQFVLDHRRDYAKVVPEADVLSFIERTFKNAIYQASKDSNEKAYLAIRKEFKSAKLEWIDEADYMFYSHYGTPEARFKARAKYIDKNINTLSSNDLNNDAWQVFESYPKDIPKLTKATAWAKRSVELKAYFANLDTYANLLFAIGKHSEALQVAQQAIDIAKAANALEEAQSTVDLHQRIQEAMKAKP
jgi:thiol-disulfide isomerase/thioredoxin